MNFVALATDYDGTLATEGRLDASSLIELKRLKAANKRLILITGRQMPDLKTVCDALALFDRVIAENGAVMYVPETQEYRLLGPRPPEPLLRLLRERGVSPLSVGDCIIATWTPHEQEILSAIRELNLDWQLIFNKGAVMCLPPGVNKASGLVAALESLNLSPHNVIGAGDAENDIAFLSDCGCSVAVANALEPVKAMADITMPLPRGAGVARLARQWLEDPATLFAALRRHDIYLGERADGSGTVALPATGSILIAGASGAGKSRLTRLLLERITEAHYQLLVVDPESDYANLEHFSHLGDASRTPAADEVVGMLAAVQGNVAVNLLATDVGQRASYFADLLGRLNGLRSNAGRPHWLVLDEAHHLCPTGAQLTALPAQLDATVFISSRPDRLAREALDTVRTVITVGERAAEVLRSFCLLTDRSAPSGLTAPNEDQVLIWFGSDVSAAIVQVGRARQPHARHVRKYAEGRLGDDNSFYFRGREGALNLKAYNLATFIDLAQGVDEDTWLFHLRRGDYSRWFRAVIKDEELAREMAPLEASTDGAESRATVAAAIKRRYIITGLD